jgi:hypothetical protein
MKIRERRGEKGIGLGEEGGDRGRRLYERWKEGRKKG